MTFRLPKFVFILFVMMSNKDNDYNLNLSSSVGGISWILAICSLCIMKNGVGPGYGLRKKAKKNEKKRRSVNCVEGTLTEIELKWLNKKKRRSEARER
jgi:hypothetical protein